MTRSARTFIVCAFGFVVLGMATTTFGVVWPSVADDFGRSLGELGYITLAYGTGYTMSSFLSGRLAVRSSIGSLLTSAAMTATIALIVLAVSPGWIIFLTAALMLGLAGGQIDAATNSYVALRHGSREMGFIHGAFGIGAIIGPLLVTGSLALGLSWRLAFVVLAVGELAYVTGLWVLTRPLEIPTDGQTTPAGSSSLRSPTLIWSVLLFALYAGIATGLGAWVFTYLTEERGLSDTAGGLAVTGHWIGFTAARLLLGSIVDRADPDRVMRWSAAATMAGIAIFWWSPATWVGFAALAFVGFAHGPIFPLEVLLTAQRFGPVLATNVVGYEIAAANVGGALIPGLIGFLVDRFGLVSVPASLLVVAALTWVAIEQLRSVSVGTVTAPTA